MAKGRRKYRLLLYEYMLDRWWPMTLLMTLFIFLPVGILWGVEWYFINPAENPLPTLSVVDGTVLLAVGSISMIFTLFLLFARKRAYIQLFDTHLRLATPFFRLNISYKRIKNTTSSQLYHVIDPKGLSGWNRELLEPFFGNTAVVVHLSAYPLPRPALLLFLSPFFFFDKTSHFVFLVDDWMAFSTDLDSHRILGRPFHQPPTYQPPKAPAKKRSSSGSSLLDDLKRE